MPDVSYVMPNLVSKTFFRAKSGVRQKPFVAAKEMPYSMWEYRVTHLHEFGTNAGNANSVWRNDTLGQVYNATIVNWDSSAIPNWARAVYNRLYNKLLSKVGERASMLTALAEMKSTSAMVASRLSQLLRAAKALKKGRFREFLRTLDVNPKPRHKNTRSNRPKDFASLWLEYWFGWAPTIGDIGNAIDAAQSDFSAERFKVGSGKRNLDIRASRLSGSFPRYDYTTTGRYIIQLRCTVSVHNRNLWVANQMGFLNPVRTMWEVVPFSWFADWFTNVGQVLGAFTDTLGMTVSDVWMTRFARVEHRLFYRSNSSRGFERVMSCAFVDRRRVQSLPRPQLELTLPKHLSWQRGATLSALLVQLFLPQKKVSLS